MKRIISKTFAVAVLVLMGYSINLTAQTCSPADPPLCVPGNGYAFQYMSDTDFGLKFNTTTTRYEFTNGVGSAMVGFNALNGDISIPGGGALQVGANRYAFQFDLNKNYGLYFNGAQTRYEFRDGGANAVFNIDANTGEVSFGPSGDLLIDPNRYVWRYSNNKNVGLYFNASTGSMEFRDNSGANVFAVNSINGNINFTGTLNGDGSGLTNLPSDGDWSISGSNIYRSSGNVGIGLIPAPTSPLDILEAATATTTYTQRVRTFNPNLSAIIHAKYEATVNNDVYGILSDTRSANGGYGIAVRGYASWYGGYFTGDGTGYTGTIYGVRGRAEGGTSGARYGVYASVSGGSAASSYAMYSIGNSFATGTWVDGSDRHLKNNISNIDHALEIIDQLKPRTYQFKQEGKYAELSLPAGQQYGFIAQEVEDIIPGSVHSAIHTFNNEDDDRTNDVEEEIKGIAYNTIIPILTQGIKEQQEIIEDQQQEIDQLKTANEYILQLIDQLTGRIDEMLPSQTTGYEGIDKAEEMLPRENAHHPVAAIGQNIPNPADGNTLIPYYIPEKVINAELKIFDINGKMIRSFQLSTGIGQVPINFHILQSGVYFYSLFIDGRIIETRKMTLQ